MTYQIMFLLLTSIFLVFVANSRDRDAFMSVIYVVILAFLLGALALNCVYMYLQFSL